MKDRQLGADEIRPVQRTQEGANMNIKWDKAILLFPVSRGLGNTESNHSNYSGFGFGSLRKAEVFHKNCHFIGVRLLAFGTLYDASPEGFAQARADNKRKR